MGQPVIIGLCIDREKGSLAAVWFMICLYARKNFPLPFINSLVYLRTVTFWSVEVTLLCAFTFNASLMSGRPVVLCPRLSSCTSNNSRRVKLTKIGSSVCNGI